MKIRIPFRAFLCRNEASLTPFAALGGLIAFAILATACDTGSEVAVESEPELEPVILSPGKMEDQYEEAIALFEEKGEEARADVRALMTPLAPLSQDLPGHLDPRRRA